ncbi:glutathione S-transferase [Pseudomonas delhiensis]|uniref:Glutathione S-transferase n=1 Tax=Pseudomonas delhiensis TaxID=366289 RepID=A0A239JRE5_9PSED|nr:MULTISPECIES: glutathione transferase GstA [Pseudomonas]PWU28415.1 glutathione transferase GstA [Pseudomonas sp. RW407]SDJ97117.1 glutathione S-transferase [Pseudomonas delhiensis]SNT08461.1 glutathione S-transferase [Pseudomonas delhiensis]
MKLYYAPGACSLASHITLRELGLPFELVRVDNRSKRTANGADYLAINPKGYVAALQLDDGQVLTEGPAILQYLADLRPEAGLAPASGGLARARLQEWLNFIGSEIHAGMNPLFDGALPEALKARFRDQVGKRLEQTAPALERSSYLLGEGFGVADAYLFTVLGWTQRLGIDLANWPALQRFVARVAVRDSVRAALNAEAQ